MAKITLEVYDYQYFAETAIDKYGLVEVECETAMNCLEITVECDSATLELYMNEEYTPGMDAETKAEYMALIQY